MAAGTTVSWYGELLVVLVDAAGAASGSSMSAQTYEISCYLMRDTRSMLTYPFRQLPPPPSLYDPQPE